MAVGHTFHLPQCFPIGVRAERSSVVLIDTPEVAGDTIVYLTQKRQEWLAGRYVSCTWDMPEFFAKKQEIVDEDLLKVRMRV